jgi:hypothetical protein
MSALLCGFMTVFLGSWIGCITGIPDGKPGSPQVTTKERNFPLQLSIHELAGSYATLAGTMRTRDGLDLLEPSISEQLRLHSERNECPNSNVHSRRRSKNRRQAAAVRSIRTKTALEPENNSTGETRVNCPLKWRVRFWWYTKLKRLKSLKSTVYCKIPRVKWYVYRWQMGGAYVLALLILFSFSLCSHPMHTYVIEISSVLLCMHVAFSILLDPLDVACRHRPSSLLLTCKGELIKHC